MEIDFSEEFKAITISHLKHFLNDLEEFKETLDVLDYSVIESLTHFDAFKEDVEKMIYELNSSIEKWRLSKGTHGKSE